MRLNKEGVDDMKIGATNYYNTDNELGDCFRWNFSGNAEVTVSTFGTDGWYVVWVRIKANAAGGSGIFTNTCPFNTWVDYDYYNYFDYGDISTSKCSVDLAISDKKGIKMI